MKDESFDINETECGPQYLRPLLFALGVRDVPGNDEEAVKLVLGVLGVKLNVTNDRGQTFLHVQSSWGRGPNVELLLLADPRVDPNLTSTFWRTPVCVDPNLTQVNGYTPLNTAANQGRDRCVELLLADGPSE